MSKVGLSVEEAAAYVGIRRATLYRLLAERAIRSFYVGRRRLILREELDRFIHERMEAEAGSA